MAAALRPEYYLQQIISSEPTNAENEVPTTNTANDASDDIITTTNATTNATTTIATTSMNCRSYNC
jgi:hypothetical protein